MANFDFETQLENALVTYLNGNVDAAVTYWSDVKKAVLSPVVKIHATPGLEEPGTMNTYAGIRLTVQLSVFTSKRRDESGREANKIRGEIRQLIGATDIVTTLNGLMGNLQIYPNGVIPQNGINLTDGANNHRAILVEFVVVPI